MRVAFVVPWERQAILVEVQEGVRVGRREVLRRWECWWRRFDVVKVATLGLKSLSTVLAEY